METMKGGHGGSVGVGSAGRAPRAPETRGAGKTQNWEPNGASVLRSHLESPVPSVIQWSSVSLPFKAPRLA